MAISRNLYTRGLKKRLAGAVWYQNKGQTLVRELAALVSNPQTDTQMEQRVKLSNLVAAYRANAPWMNKYSFESKKQTWSDYNAFVSANIKDNRVYLDKEAVMAGAGVVYPYIFTKGTLPSVNVTADNSNEVFYTDLYTGELTITAADTTTTVAQLSAALIENNNGLREGDQLSFIWNIQQTNPDNGTPFITGRYEEIILDLSDTTPVADRVGVGMLLTDEYGGMTCLCFTYQSGASVQGGICIVSRSASGSIKVSSQRMIVNDDSYYSTFTTSAAKRAAIRSYAGSLSEPFLVPTYQGGGTIDAPVTPSVLSVTDLYAEPQVTYTIQDFVPVVSEDEIEFKLNLSPKLDVSTTITEAYARAWLDQDNSQQAICTPRIENGDVIVNFSVPAGGQYLQRIEVITANGIHINTGNFPWGGEVTNGGDVTE